MYSTEENTDSVTPIVHVASTNCYELIYDSAKNRIYFTLTGYWKSKNSVPAYLSDWQKALALTRSGFSVLSDLRTMITHPPSINNLHIEVQKLIGEGGVVRVARLDPIDLIAKLQVEQIYGQSSLPLLTFATPDDAEEWLNKA
ncbi:hypothetical protein ACSX1A_17110 [Pontibacter sp. MBLB2868]|uniref:hypothetical protein n=1 Tax=Pontibacter sp. MBLB2868 TaxID=3451555 RepID=UPI003F7543D3